MLVKIKNWLTVQDLLYAEICKKISARKFPSTVNLQKLSGIQ